MNKDFVLKIGQKIRKLREEKGLSQFDLALEIGTTPGAVGNFETARNDTSVSRLYAIAKALGIEPYELLKFDEDE